MDRAAADAEGKPEDPAAAGPPSIGVPSIPTRAVPVRPPVPVPSVTVPADTGPTGEEEGGAATSEGPVTGRASPAPRAALLTAPARRSARVASAGTSPVPIESDRSPGPVDADRGVTTGAESGHGSGPADGPPDHDPFGMAFPPGVAAKLGWYVYLLVAPGSGQPFYVGRGRGDRCFQHVQAARPGASEIGVPGDGPVGGDHQGTGTPPGRTDPRPRKFPALDRIRQIDAEEGPVRVEILRYGLSPDEARLVMSAASDALGLPADLKRGSQRQGAADLGTRLAKRAKFKRDHQVVLLRVGPKGADTDYDRVRHGWRIGRRWTDPRSTRSPRWAVIVAGELVVGVYRIEGWEATPLQGRPGRPGPPGTTRSTYRQSFIGVRDDQLESRYVGRSVAGYLGSRATAGTGAAVAVGASNQVAYVWCGPHAIHRAG